MGHGPRHPPLSIFKPLLQIMTGPSQAQARSPSLNYGVVAGLVVVVETRMLAAEAEAAVIFKLWFLCHPLLAQKHAMVAEVGEEEFGAQEVLVQGMEQRVEWVV